MQDSEEDRPLKEFGAMPIQNEPNSLISVPCACRTLAISVLGGIGIYFVRYAVTDSVVFAVVVSSLSLLRNGYYWFQAKRERDIKQHRVLKAIKYFQYDEEELADETRFNQDCIQERYRKYLKKIDRVYAGHPTQQERRQELEKHMSAILEVLRSQQKQARSR